MHRYDPARQRLALGLAGLAGLVDATGFVVAGGYFTSFMSGNTTRMGVELVERPALALAPLGLIAAFLAGVVVGAVVGRRFAGRHKRVLLGLVAGVLTAGAGLLAAGYPVPFLALSAMAMGLANNVFVRAGEVTVVNFWASWCPPCRREMPVFEEAQAKFPDVVVVLVNQGESVQQARAFLESNGLNLTDVLIDPASDAMRATGSRGLPATLFFDAQGRMVDSHLGEITLPSLTDKMLSHFGPFEN